MNLWSVEILKVNFVQYTTTDKIKIVSNPSIFKINLGDFMMRCSLVVLSLKKIN